MKGFDLIGRIQRTIACKMRKYYHKKWQQIKPQDFYDNPERVTALWYAFREGRMPNFQHPTDFNERLMALNLAAYYDKSQWPIRITGADKYAVRQFIKDKGFGDILNECYGVYDSFDAIDFDKLPNQFVLKTTHGSGKNFICKDKTKLNIQELKALTKDWLKRDDFGLTTGEWHYNLIEPRFIVEKFLYTPGEDVSLIDYKFHCIHGKVYGEYVCYDRINIPGVHSVNYDHYDADWNLTDGVLPSFHSRQRPITKPKNFEEMKDIAEKLSEGLEYMRVDFYEVDDKIIFGELTFTPMGNFLPYTHERLVDMEQFYERTSNK